MALGLNLIKKVIMKKQNRIDITGEIGPLVDLGPPEIPMYSYRFPSDYFWNGIANGLKKKRFTENQIKDWLQSKQARWTIDKYCNEIEELGEKIGLKENLK